MLRHYIELVHEAIVYNMFESLVSCSVTVVVRFVCLNGYPLSVMHSSGRGSWVRCC